MKQYVNLHNHTTFSMLDGHGPIKKYVERAKELGQPGLAITDHGNLHGWLDHYEKCKEHDIKPILGIEGYLARKTRFDQDEEERAGRATDELEQRGPYHITILAKNQAGYHNLIKLSSASYLEGYYVKPRLDHELIANHSEGLIVLSGCLNGEVNQALLRGDHAAALEKAALMQSIVGRDNYFIEIHNHGIPEQLEVIPGLIEIAKQIDAKIVAAGDCHYVNKEDHGSHDALICVSTGAKVADENRFKFFGPEFYLKSYEEMAEYLEPEWLDNTMLVNEMVDIHLDFLEPDSVEYHFPAYPKLEPGISVSETLARDVKAGLVRRYGDNPSREVLDRLEHEMGVIHRMGFESYFLVVADLVNWAKNNNIAVGAGRGSAAGSLVSFVLGITNIDPIRFDLLFERFLVEGRKSMPDIDIDIADRDRGRVIDYVRETYGDERVAHIVTFSEVKARAAIKDTARVLGYEAKVSDRISKLLPPAVMGVTKTLKESFTHTEFKEAYDSEEDTRIIVDTAMGVEGVHRQTGVHAAGIVIGDSDIANYVPLMQKGEGETITTQWDMYRVEEAGLLKIDFLGLRNLTVVQDAIGLMKDGGLGVDLDDPNQPYDDPKTYKLLQKGHTVGIFQLESGPMSDMAVRLRPEDINDIMALISLYRPGPLGSNMDKMYINRKHGREKVSNYHEAIADLMQPTYGLMIYQDQILKLLQILAGFSPADADDLRKAIGKKLMDKIGLFREKFVQGCKDTTGIDARLANKIYDDIEFFGGYGFNKAHAISYGVLAYQNAFLKAHYPSEYMAALMTSVSDNKEKLFPYLDECRKMTLEVSPPSVITSDKDFTVKDGKLVFGLSAIDGVGEALTHLVIEDREREGPSSSFYEFMKKSSPGALDKRSVEKLLFSGALDDVISNSEDEISDKAIHELLLLEQQQVGIFITGHPLEGIWETVENTVSHTISDLEDVEDGEIVTVAGVITGFSQRTTKSGNKMFTVKISDMAGITEFIIFQGSITKENLKKEDFNVGIGIRVVLRVKRDVYMDENRTSFYYVRHEVILDSDVTKIPPHRMDITKCINKMSILDDINDIIKKNKGDIPLVFRFNVGDNYVDLTNKNRITKIGIKELEVLISESS